jgi:prevent-host-death family protein
MPRATAQEFQRNIGRYQDLALREPVEITRHGREHLVLLSADEYRRLKGRDRRAYAAEELQEELLEKVAASKMAKRHKKLDRLLDEK